MKILLCVLIFVLNCAVKITEPQQFKTEQSINRQVFFYSTDLVLKKIICEQMEISGFATCVLYKDPDLREQSENIKYIFLETQIKDSSSDYFLNSGKSLLTLTFGVFLTNSANVDFIFYVEDSKETILENTNISSFGRVGYWGVLPFYTGFIATNLGTFLNTYRRPDHLQRYCLYEVPTKMRETLEVKREEYCKEYELFLKESFYKVQTDFFKKLEIAFQKVE